MHLLSEAAVVPQGQNGISATETTCPSNARSIYCLIMYRKELSVKKKSLIILIFKSFIKHRMMETAVNEDAMF